MKSERRQYIYLIAGVLIVALAILLVLFYTSYHKGWDRFPGSVHKVSQSVVIIRVLNIDSTSSPICTGFVVDKRGYIVTAKHCFETITNDINYRLNASYSISEVIDKIGLAEIKVGENTAHSGITLVQNDNLSLKSLILIKLKDIPQFELLPVRIATKEELTQIGIEIGFVGYTEADDNMSDFEIFIGKGILLMSNWTCPVGGNRTIAFKL
jgi:hypothetical protein